MSLSLLQQIDPYVACFFAAIVVIFSWAIISNRRAHRAPAIEEQIDLELERALGTKVADKRVSAFLSRVYRITMDLASQHNSGKISLRVAANAVGFPAPPRISRRSRYDRAFNLMRQALRGNGHTIRRHGTRCVVITPIAT